MERLPSLLQNLSFSFSYPLFHVCLLFLSLLGSVCALTMRHQRIIASAMLKYECAPIFAASLPFCSLWHLRGISGWFCARLSPPHYRGTGSIDSSPRAEAFLSLSFRCLLHFNPSAPRCSAEPEVFVMCGDNDKKLSVHVRTISTRQGRILRRWETSGLHAILATKDDRYWCWGILSRGGDGAKTQRQANTHCQVHGCCHKKRFPQRFLWNTHGPDALLAAKRVWILESPLAHLAVAAHRPVAERKDKIDFSLHRHVLYMTLCLSELVWEVRGCSFPHAVHTFSLTMMMMAMGGPEDVTHRQLTLA